MTKTKWCVIQKTKTKSEFAVKIKTAADFVIRFPESFKKSSKIF